MRVILECTSISVVQMQNLGLRARPSPRVRWTGSSGAGAWHQVCHLQSLACSNPCVVQHQEPVWEDDSRLVSSVVPWPGPWPPPLRWTSWLEGYLSAALCLPPTSLPPWLVLMECAAIRTLVFGLNDSSWHSFLLNTLFFLVTV